MKKTLALIICLSLSLFFSHLACARMYGAIICKEEGYECKHIKKGQSWRKLWPNAYERDIVMRVNRMNTQLYAGLTIAVPKNLTNADILDFAPFDKQIEAANEKLVMVDPSHNAWAAYAADGKLIRWGPISAGADFCKDIDQTCRTHDGDYRIYSLGSSDCHSRKFPLPNGGAPMPYCMYFYNGQALHGEPNGLPGYNASHGCVRMYVNDAEWLRYSFVEAPNETNDYRGTKIVVNQYQTENPYQDGDDDSMDDNDTSYTDTSYTDNDNYN